MFAYLSSFFSSPRPSTSPEESPSTPAIDSPAQAATNPAHTQRNRKKRLAKKKSKQRRRQSTLGGLGSDGELDEEEDEDRGDESFPDADEDDSYLPLEPDNTPLSSTTVPTSRPPRKAPSAPPQGAQPSQIPPQEVLAAVSRLPPLLPNGERLPNDERAKRIIASQGFVPVEDQDGGLHVGVKVREGVVAVMGKDGPLLFQM